MQSVEKLASGPLTKETLASLDKDTAFWTYFKHAAQQKQLTVTKEYYFANPDKSNPTPKSYIRTGFDYTTKKIVQASESTEDPILKVREKRRCYDGKVYSKPLTTANEWKDDTARNRTNLCNLEVQGTAVNDGMNTGGLTNEQADAFINDLRIRDGLITVKSVNLTTKNNRQYLHFKVALRPIKSGKYDYLGNQWWMFAFKKTGLDPATHPFGYSGTGGQGTDIDYVVDPRTKLPAYAELSTAPPTSEEVDPAGYSHYRILYEFNRMPDVTIENNTNITLDW